MSLLEAREHLLAGGVVAAATESFFGLLAAADQPSAVDQLFRLKPRDTGKGVGLMVPDGACWKSWVTRVPRPAQTLAEAFWPGGLTIVLEAAKGVDPRLCVGGTIGVRQPGPSVAADLVAAYGGALTATSANLAGEPPCRTEDELLNAFEAQLGAGLLVAVRGCASGGPVSTLLRVDDAGYQVLRAGAVREEDLARCFSSTSS